MPLQRFGRAPTDTHFLYIVCDSLLNGDQGTMLGIALLWIGLYGVGFALTWLPSHISTPTAVLHNLPFVLQGYYDIHVHGRIIAWSAVALELLDPGNASVGVTA